MFQELEGDPYLFYYYSFVRGQTLKSLKAGGLILQWDQMRIGGLTPLPSYQLFSRIFANWLLYDASAPPADSKLRCIVSTRCGITHAEALQTQKKFVEVRYLSDPESMRDWCRFEMLETNNPRLSG